ncbi:Hypothetical predicted protein [Paramuricea clavata]|uniref:Reverse transcriptase domain-containing protein n=1 Tax=Paramuricea clavata TaxID=317549 RepID=A0A6S7I1T3_PARCT|nr:Hypothetical predicted protein [Paramuricea clavata]
MPTKNVLEIELLIGADYLWLFQEGRTVRGKSDEPVAVQTKLGWVLSGPLKSSSEDDDGPTSCAQLYSVQRLKGQLLRLKKEPEVLQEYDRVIKEQLELGIIEPVVELERADKIHYLPHHAVVRKDAKTTKVRVVYDASSKETKKGVSLNDCLHVGPPLYPLLYHIILRFREKRIALVADIEKAFLNIEIDPCDRDCLRFLWVGNIHEDEVKPVEYRFCRVVFGVNCSPFLLNATLQHHLDRFSKGNPELTRKLKDGFYVDDLLRYKDHVQHMSTSKLLLNKLKYVLDTDLNVAKLRRSPGEAILQV